MGEQKGKSERTKVYIIIGLGIVFCMVGYYRFLYQRSPGEVPAAAPSPPVAAALAAGDMRPRETGGDGPTDQEVAEDVVRDIFEPPMPFKTGDVKSEGADNATGAMTPLVLNGIILSEGNTLAVINGQFQRVGDQVGGYKIVRIGVGGVLLRGENRETALRIIDYGHRK
jgi:hypothetical protein